MKLIRILIACLLLTALCACTALAEGGPGRTYDGIYEHDDRIVINNTGEYPYRAIAYMVIRSKCGKETTGTGFLISPDLFMTAAHCVICQEHSDWPQELTLYFGYKNNNNYVTKFTGSYYGYAGNLFRDHKYSTDNDYAILKLDRRIGDKLGWFGFKCGVPDKDLTLKVLYLTGYRYGVMTHDYDWVEPISSKLLSHHIDMQHGNSGSPLYDDDNTVYGINISSTDSYNIAMRLTNEVYDKIIELGYTK